MVVALENFFSQIHPALRRFAERIVAGSSVKSISYDIGDGKNEAFFLRAYLSLNSIKGGDEIAVTIDGRVDTDILTLTSDICTENGQELAIGPKFTHLLSKGKYIPEEEFFEWLSQFNNFLREAESRVIDEIANLPPP